ncbi:unnamed protein product [Mucor hiemalis]
MPVTSNASERSNMREFMSRFRVQDNSLMSFPTVQRNQIIAFQKFASEKPDGFCSICLKKIYPEERKFRKVNDMSSLNCTQWNQTPITKEERGITKYLVCKDHFRMEEADFLVYVYPGDVLEETKDLNYRERCAISPIKISTQITRKSNMNSGTIGHYQLTGAVDILHNFEFAKMAYGGTLGLYYLRGDPRTINKARVTAAYKALKRSHPLLKRYDLPKLTKSLVNYHIKESSKFIGRRQGWPHIGLFDENNINPEAADVEFSDLIIGTDHSNNFIKYIRLSTESLPALMFPHIYPKCQGHYSMSSPSEKNTRLSEDHGGIAKATLYKETLKGYTRLRLLMQDRRFAKDQAFIFFLLDCVERNNIASANRHIVSNKGRGSLKQRDIIN